jgi:membrane protease YdiL (CAAX protease family)
MAYWRMAKPVLVAPAAVATTDITSATGIDASMGWMFNMSRKQSCNIFTLNRPNSFINRLKPIVLLAVIFWLSLYYLLSFGLETIRSCQDTLPHTRQADTFLGLWNLSISILFLISMLLIIKRSKHFDIFFSFSLIISSLNIFSSFRRWVGHNYSLIFSEWIIISLFIIGLSIWWFKDIAKHNAERMGGLNWRVSDAFGCLVGMVFTYIIIGGLLIALKHKALHSPIGLTVAYIITFAILLMITFLYSRVKSLNEFKKEFCLNTLHLYPAFIAAMSGSAIAALAVTLIKLGVITPHNNFAQDFGTENTSYFNLILLLAPFWEEIILRGYLYGAFRLEYSVSTSMFCMLVIAFLSHFSVICATPLTAVIFLGLNAVIVLFREKTGNIWNCIACHFTYNLICLLN